MTPPLSNEEIEEFLELEEKATSQPFSETFLERAELVAKSRNILKSLLLEVKESREVIGFYSKYETESYEMHEEIFSEDRILKCVAYNIGQQARAHIKKFSEGKE